MPRIKKQDSLGKKKLTKIIYDLERFSNLIIEKESLK